MDEERDDGEQWLEPIYEYFFGVQPDQIDVQISACNQLGSQQKSDQPLHHDNVEITYWTRST